MELANSLSVLVTLLDNFRDKLGDPLDQVRQIHRGTPIFLLFWDNIQK